MVKQRIGSLIQFAKRAKKVAFKQTLHHFLIKNKVGVLFIANDASENTIKEFNSYKNQKIITNFTKSELGNILSKDEVSVVGILDMNISKQIIKWHEGGNVNG